MNVVRPGVVATALTNLRRRRTHPLFAGYLHLRQKAVEFGKLDELRPDFLGFFNRYFRVDGHPIGMPFVKPFTPHKKPTTVDLWLNRNVAGSYAPSSLRAGQPFRKVVDVSPDGAYTLRPDHAARAREVLLFGESISAADLAIFLYRDSGLLDGIRTVPDLVRCFAAEFGYAAPPAGLGAGDYERHLAQDEPDVRPADWLAPYPAADSPVAARVAVPGGVLPLTREPVRGLSADDLLGPVVPEAETPAGPPLQEFRVKGLLSFGDEVVFEFGRLNLLVGPNGSGKSNLIDCLRLVRGSPRDIQVPLKTDGFNAWLHLGAGQKTGEVRITARVPGVELPVIHSLRFGPATPSGVLLEEYIDTDRADADPAAPLFTGSHRSPAVVATAGGPRRRRRRLGADEYQHTQSILQQLRDAVQYPELTRLAALYDGVRIYSEWSFGRKSRLRDPSTTSKSDPQLNEEMTDLAATLNLLSNSPAHEAIKMKLPELKSSYRDYKTRTIFNQIGLELEEAVFTSTVPAARLSDGTLRFLALASILLRTDPPAVTCIEEPELGMHPDMIRMVADMIADAATRTQLLVTTHSEHLLTALQDRFDVLFAFDAVQGQTVVRRLTRAEFEGWRADHALGELWTSGELGGVRY